MDCPPVVICTVYMYNMYMDVLSNEIGNKSALKMVTILSLLHPENFNLLCGMITLMNAFIKSRHSFSPACFDAQVLDLKFVQKKKQVKKMLESRLN